MMEPLPRRYVLGWMLSGLVGAAFCLTACGPPSDGDGSVDFALQDTYPSTVLPGTHYTVRGSGFREDDSVRITFEGTIGGRSVEVARPATVVSGDRVYAAADGPFLDAMGTSEGDFSGTIDVTVVRDGDKSTRTRDVEFTLTESLTPSIERIRPKTAAFMDEIAVVGSGLLLDGEGQTVLKASGTFEADEGNDDTFDDLILPLKPSERRRAWYVPTPEKLGLRTGTFEGTFQIENWHDGSGGEVVGDELSVTLEIRPPQLDGIEPASVSRGQRLEIFGAGFIPSASESRQRTSLVLTGEFTDTSGRTEAIDGSNALTLDPDFVEAGVVEYVIRPDIVEDGTLKGLGSEPGVFDGDMQARIHRDGRTLTSAPQSVRLTILPPKQVVYLKYLPGFSDSLRKFGLRNVEQKVRDRILEVCERDYEPFNVSCRTRPPTDYADYLTVEIGGRDPNGRDFFGLDNSEGVDTGNLRLGEIVGGRRPAEEDDQFVYGGVFVESFLAFSPSLRESIPIESPRFDDIFGPFAPGLDGKPVQVDEYPSGPRTGKIDKAIEVLGNLAGGTVVHEAGHAMGLANTGLGGKVHHAGLNPKLIMNSGADRSFEQRAEIDDEGPGIWGQRDSEYLKDILP